MTSKIRAVIFDYGNVLCPMPPPSAFEELARIAGVGPHPFLESLWRHRLEYDRGIFDSASYWRQVARENGKIFSEAQIRKLIDVDFALWVNPSPTMLEWARSLRQSGVKTSILSNMPREFSGYLRSTAGWLRDFDRKVFSGELGVVKPDAQIYQACLEGLEVRPENALFIDDVGLNVEAARALGIEAIKFESIVQLAADIRKYGLAVPLG